MKKISWVKVAWIIIGILLILNVIAFVLMEMREAAYYRYLEQVEMKMREECSGTLYIDKTTSPFSYYCFYLEDF